MATTSSTGTTAAPGHAEPERGEVVVGAAGVGEERLVEGGRAGQHGDALGCDPLA